MTVRALIPSLAKAKGPIPFPVQTITVTANVLLSLEEFPSATYTKLVGEILLLNGGSAIRDLRLPLGSTTPAGVGLMLVNCGAKKWHIKTSAGVSIALLAPGRIAKVMINSATGTWYYGVLEGGVSTGDDLLNITPATTLTIAAGVITVDQSAHAIETQGGAGTDDLDTVLGLTAGAFYDLTALNAAHTVVVKHLTGNIYCPAAKDVSLAESTDHLFGYSPDGTVLVVLSASVLDPFGMGFGHYLADAATFVLNQDATAAVGENPSITVKGGDAVAAPNDDIVETIITQDSVNERVSIKTLRARNGGAFASVPTILDIGGAGDATVADRDAEVDLNSTTTAPAAVQARIIFRGQESEVAINPPAGGKLGTDRLVITANLDAAPATDEDPVFELLGGDGVGAPNDDLVRTRLTQDSTAERVILNTKRTRNGGAEAEVAVDLNIGTPGVILDIDQAIKLNSGDGAAARQGTITQVGTNRALELSGGLVTRTTDLGFTVNSDAAAATDEDPNVVLLGGDGVGAPNDDVVRTTTVQDSTAETLTLKTERSRNGGGFAEVPMALNLGTAGQVADIDMGITLNSGDGAAARPGSIVQNGTSRAVEIQGGLETRTKDPDLVVNSDATAAAAENPRLKFLGGDGVGAPNDDIVESTLVQDSANELIYFLCRRSRNGAGFAPVAPDFEVGFPGDVTPSLNPVLGFNGANGGGVAQRAYFTWNATALSLLASGPANTVFGTNGTVLGINEDATAAGPEYPTSRMSAGDGVAAPNDDIVRQYFGLDPVNEVFQVYMTRARNGGAAGAIAMQLELGQVGTAAPANLNPSIGFNGTTAGPAARRASLTWMADQNLFVLTSSQPGPKLRLDNDMTLLVDVIDEDDTASGVSITHHTNASCFRMFEDFVGPAGSPLPTWLGTQDTSAVGAPILNYVSDAACGNYQLQLAIDNEVEEITLYSTDNLWINLSSAPRVTFRVRVTSDPAGAGGSLGATGIVVIGIGSDRNATLDNMAVNAWFRLQGLTHDLFVETDDNGGHDTDDADTLFNWAESTWYTLTIDFSNLAAVKFYVNGIDRTPAAGMNMSGLAPNTVVQPFIELQKGAAANLDNLVLVDFIEVNANR